MSEAWVWVEDLSQAGSIALSPEEARHVTARRLRVGDSLVVFDGQGRTADARIESVARHTSLVTIASIAETPRPKAGFVLASAIPKGDRLSTMLQMLTQLGLESWQPLVLEDSSVRKLDPNGKRLVRILIESCKVSRRSWLLEIRDPCTLAQALAARSPATEIVFGDREGEVGGLDDSVGLAVIGPEAGFSDSERRALDEVGARARSFGAYNLRIETAAAAATVAHHLAGAEDSAREATG